MDQGHWPPWILALVESQKAWRALVDTGLCWWGLCYFLCDGMCCCLCSLFHHQPMFFILLHDHCLLHASFNFLKRFVSTHGVQYSLYLCLLIYRRKHGLWGVSLRKTVCCHDCVLLVTLLDLWMHLFELWWPEMKEEQKNKHLIHVWWFVVCLYLFMLVSNEEGEGWSPRWDETYHNEKWSYIYSTTIDYVKTFLIGYVAMLSCLVVCSQVILSMDLCLSVLWWKLCQTLSDKSNALSNRHRQF